MADYSLVFLNSTNDIRSFFSPPLDYDDVPEAELLLKIEAVETYVKDVYELTTSAEARIGVMLLVASKIIQTPSLARKYFTLQSETLGDYAYSLAPAGSSPLQIAKSWEDLAHEMLRAKSFRKNYKLKVYISND